jgi:hypothetical protein
MVERKVNAKKLRETLPTLLTPPNLSMWDRNVVRERNDYHCVKFKKNTPGIEQEKFSNILNALDDYKQAQEKFWRGNSKKYNGS